MASLLKNRENVKLAAANIILVANAFIWYLIAFNTLKVLLANQGASPTDTLTILGLNTAAIAIAGLIGTFVVGKFVKHKRFLYLWIASGVALSLIPILINPDSLSDITILSVFFGTYFGIGMPATMGFHSGQIKIEHRAKIGGITFLLIGVTFAMTSLISETSILEICIVLAILRIIGFITLRFMKTTEPPKQATAEVKVKYTSILSNKSFILYFIPWLMFTLINYMTIPIQNAIYSTDATVSSIYTYTFHAELEAAVTATIAIISGFIADKLGRKRLSIIGFIMLGIGYAAMGFASANYNANATPMQTVANTPNLWIGSLLFAITDGAAWGIFYVLFLFTLWGDLAQDKKSDKFYFLGALPYVSAYLMQLVLSPLLVDITMVTYFSFASIFLFIAVLPLIYAPETLPEKVMKDRDLKTYVEKAKKKASKENVKASRKEKQSEQESDKPAAENSSYEEAKALAEKYY